MMKMPTLRVLTLGILIGVSMARAGQWEVQQAFDYYLPEDAFWDQAYGGEMKLVYWQQPSVGLAFSAGLSQWESEGEQTSLPSTSGGLQPFQKWEGDIQYVPLGASLLLRESYMSRDFGECQLTLEAGCRYMRCDSQMELVQTFWVQRNPGQPFEKDVTRYSVDCDDSIVGRLAAQLAIQINEQSNLFVAGGYQFDLDSGEIAVDSRGQSVPLDLSAFFVQAGVAFYLK